MNDELTSECRERAEIFKALGHPSRLFIVEQLQDGPRCVSELTELIGADMSTVSRHLDVLMNCGLLGREKEGTMVNYRLRLPCVLRFFDCVDDVLTADRECGRVCQTDCKGEI